MPRSKSITRNRAIEPEGPTVPSSASTNKLDVKVFDGPNSPPPCSCDLIHQAISTWCRHRSCQSETKTCTTIFTTRSFKLSWYGQHQNSGSPTECNHWLFHVSLWEGLNRSTQPEQVVMTTPGKGSSALYRTSLKALAAIVAIHISTPKASSSRALYGVSVAGVSAADTVQSPSSSFRAFSKMHYRTARSTGTCSLIRQMSSQSMSSLWNGSGSRTRVWASAR